jgi:hypothetical protein
MWWRRASIGIIVGLWIAMGVAWGPTAALVYGFFLLIACVLVMGAAVGGDATQRFGTWYYNRQLHGRRRR